MPAANGADADVPVCSTVQMRSGRNRPSISTVATLLSWPGVPELYVVANVDEHSSKYHGLYLFIGGGTMNMRHTQTHTNTMAKIDDSNDEEDDEDDEDTHTHVVLCATVENAQ